MTIERLNNSILVGQYIVHPRIQKDYAEMLAHTLSIFFTNGCFLSSWKEAFIT